MNTRTGTILVVDDNEMNCDLLERRLRRLGHTVLVAMSGMQALEQVDCQAVDLVLLDVMMPEVDGLQVLARLRERFTLAELPVIMVTAKNNSEDVVEALKLGANDYVTKPIDFPVLLARLQTHLELRQLSQLKDEFLRIASHDIKNPLTEVRGTASLVELLMPPGTPMTQEVFELVANIQSSACHIQTIIEDFLDFQAVEAGSLRLRTAPLDLNRLAREVVERHGAYASEKGISLRFSALHHLPEALGDRERLVQVTSNLVNNALKFCPPGASVEVRTRLGDGRALIEVCDSGPGLTEEDQRRLFVKYARLSNRPTGGEKSSGLGLAIAKQLVEAQAGAMGARNNPGGGATFWFELPLAQPGSVLAQVPLCS